MTTFAQLGYSLSVSRAWTKLRQTSLGQRPETAIFLLLVAGLSLPAIAGVSTTPYVFLPAAVASGEWWRLLTHPFVHVSWYHLLLDGAAFFMLYHSLAEKSLWRRLSLIFGAIAGSLLISWAFAPSVATQGLCGLSGIAHGLMAVSALEQISAARLNSPAGRLGLITFASVVGKAALEGARGRLFFSWLHFGLLGNPVAISHAGGIIGALLVLLLFRCLNRSERP